MFQLGMIEGISRPAIAAIWPTLRGQTVVLDCGANVVGDAEQLVDFAVMGEAFAHAILGLDKPSVGLLNVGAEEQKGNDAVKGAAQILRAATAADLPMAFHGFVEGNDIAEGTVDVVVTDGFTGNIALKTAEGTAKLVGQFLRRSLKRSLLGQIGAFIASGALNTLRRKLDPRAANGGIFLGLERRGGEKPWRHRRDRLRPRARHGHQHGQGRHQFPHHRRPRAASGTVAALHDPLARHRLRRLSAGQHRHQ